jgi:hypothetical protein
MGRALGIALFAAAQISRADQSTDAAGPAVKKSQTQICHPRGTKTYAQTRRYKAYDSLQACLDAGGRLPKGVTVDRGAPAAQAPNQAVFNSGDPSFVRKSRAGICYEATDRAYRQVVYFEA